MTDAQRKTLEDAEDAVFESMTELENAQATSGIRPPPLVEETESTLDPQLFGLDFGGEPESEVFPSSSVPPEPPPCIEWQAITYIEFQVFFPVDPSTPGLIRLSTSPTSAGNYFSVEAEGPLTNQFVWRAVGGVTMAVAFGTVSTGTWITVDIKITMSGGVITKVAVNGGADVTLTGSTITISELFFGAIKSGAPSPSYDFRMRNLKIGTTFGGSDLFSDDFSTSIVPPFDSVTGTGISIDSGSLLINNAGTLAYATRCITSP